MEKPIDELFPELMAGYPKTKTWETLGPLAREGELLDLVERKFKVKVHVGPMNASSVYARLEAMLEWTLRHGKLHPDLPTVHPRLAGNPNLVLD
jgi:hypothetical protein